jgi:hypothetical protein
MSGQFSAFLEGRTRKEGTLNVEVLREGGREVGSVHCPSYTALSQLIVQTDGMFHLYEL